MSSRKKLMPMMGMALAASALLASCSTSGRAPTLSSEPEGFADIGSRGDVCEEGSLRECSVKLSARQGAVTCLRGHQECRGGAWSACGQKTVSFVTRRMGFHSAVPSACSDNPCNPECMDFDESPDIPIGNPPAPGFSFEGNPNEWGNAPDGFESKQDCGRSQGGCLGSYPKKCGGDPMHYNQFDACQADHHCDAVTNTCKRNDPGWTWPASVCDGIDLSVGPACYNGQNDGFPVCNRGNTAIPSGASIQIALVNGNEFDLSKCPPKLDKPTVCSLAVNAPLLPGECLRVVRGPACQWSGNVVAFVNWDLSIPECGLPLAQPPQKAKQPGCSNNWSDVKTGAACQLFVEEAYEPLTFVEEYTATCPVGTRPLWGLLAYEATTPCSPGACHGDNASSVKFEIQSSNAFAPGALTDWVTVAHAPDPPHTHPSTCTLSGPSPCPVQLASIMQAPRDDNLRLRVTLGPSPDGKAAASLKRWRITYNCEAVE